MKTILITGSNKGIGLETARQLAKKGWRVILSGRDAGRLAAAADSLRSEFPQIEYLVMDIADDDSVAAAAKTFTEWKLTLDVLMNNAAILLKEDNSLINDPAAIYRQTINTNCHGALRVTRTFLCFLENQGRIINVSSGGGSMTDPVGGWSPAYCASKTLLNGLTRQLAYELKPKGIAVNAVCPGWVKTDMGGRSAPRSVEKGAETPVWLADEAPASLTDRFFRDKMEISW